MLTLLGDLLAHRLAQNLNGTLGKRLYDVLQGAIQDGSIATGRRLPASRDLAKDLSVSRNTVLTAYEQLQSEGYLQTRAGSGTFVCDPLPESAPEVDKRPPADGQTFNFVRFSSRGARLLARSGAGRYQWGAFMPGVPDVSHMPHDIWRKIRLRISRRMPVEALSYSGHGGCLQLQQALADYLRVIRSVNCTPEQILITAGTHQSLDLLAKMLCDPGDRAWIEEPGYWGIRNVLAVNGIELLPTGVDEQGMMLPALSGEARPPRLICVTPSHQYPLGSVMSLQRRHQLLALAKSTGSWVVEDDYDGEFRFAETPIPALQGLAADAPVIYLGTFSKSLYPGLRLSYMVVPRPLAARMKMAHSELYRGGNGLEQLTLAEFIGEGHYAAHVRRMRQLYSRRRAALVQVIRENLGESFIARQSNAGLHLILALPDNIDDVALSAELEQNGVLTRPLSAYYLLGAAKRGLLLGYACVDEQQMAEKFAPILTCLASRLQR
ncbi:MocR-like pyridoxine biosynthesis transcription factor PdxR [Erwinia amylovora]|uniref:PLP-dependent aminotransferase family protein n=4 Tax=Erwinia amylovora TaxID=552 RepID=A0ABX7MFN2_ERWAM|nr:PLP-dependent aminotransferase family protein [Erwinia amylovora]CBX81275.1 putative GntR-family regulatory protein [Erwinia amylovora ATCC BAA-2158]CDK15808.1 putative GntR-family regulatory protein [Erwinia amylovora LA635]CDK19174.1 putative GntR-family regulatory protein [Erwinia amylovora LA636]CDK22545.1 putative GntR-family regulatory protein [Erwinia amylovora LA637]ATZ12091.1 PLP-dependent aminotransferase family protein [Erwinia amylovora]